MAEHHLALDYIMGSNPAHFLPVSAGIALLNARRERLHPGTVVSFAAGRIARARAAERRRCEEHNAALTKGGTRG